MHARGHPRSTRPGPLRALLALCLAGLIAALAAPAPVAAQNFGRAVSPILTLDRDRLFAGTLYGQRINRELEAASTAMAAETRAIEADLEAEELELTEQRATMEPEAFRALATAFDEKVQALRESRKAAETDLLAQIEDAQSAFFSRIGPILGQLVRDRGAVLIVDRRAVLLSATDVDITSDAIERIDAVLGDGTDLVTGDDAPGETTAPVLDPATELDTGLDTDGDGATAVDTIPAPAPVAPDETPDDASDN